MSDSYRLNLPEIQRSLRKVQRNFERINKKLDVSRDPLEDIIIENLMLGYAYMDQLLEKKAIYSIGGACTMYWNSITLFSVVMTLRYEKNFTNM